MPHEYTSPKADSTAAEDLMDTYQPGPDDLDGMVLAWRRATAGEPWHRAPERFGDDPMIQVIGAVLEVTLSAGMCLVANERLVRAAAAHGDLRRLQGVEEGTVFGEYRVLGTALWDRLRETRSTAEISRAVIRLDRVLRTATSAAMQGYHRSDRSHPSWASQLQTHIALGSASLASLFEDHVAMSGDSAATSSK
jgi:hypothetical protein